MLRLLAALAALLSSLAPFHHEPTGDSPTFAASSQALHLDASALPGDSGWFFTRVTADRDVLVTVDGTFRNVASGAGPHASALVLAYAGHAPIVSGMAGSSGRDAELDARGAPRVVCCDVAGGEGARSDQHAEGLVGPTHPLWIGLVTSAWSPDSRLDLTLTPHGGALHADAPLHGEMVQSYDLVDLAHADGTEARVAGVTVAGHAGAGVLHRIPNGAAFLSVVAVAAGEDEATLHVALPNGTPLPAHIVSHGTTLLQAIKRGPVDVRLDDVRDESTRSLTRDTRSALLAVVLYADIDAPLDGFAMSILGDDQAP